LTCITEACDDVALGWVFSNNTALPGNQRGLEGSRFVVQLNTVIHCFGAKKVICGVHVTYTYMRVERSHIPDENIHNYYY